MKILMLCAVLVFAGVGTAFSQNIESVRGEVADLAVAYKAEEAEAAAMYLEYVEKNYRVIERDLANFDVYLPVLKSPKAIKAAQKYMLAEQQKCAEKLALLKLISE